MLIRIIFANIKWTLFIKTSQYLQYFNYLGLNARNAEQLEEHGWFTFASVGLCKRTAIIQIHVVESCACKCIDTFITCNECHFATTPQKMQQTLTSLPAITQRWMYVVVEVMAYQEGLFLGTLFMYIQ